MTRQSDTSENAYLGGAVTVRQPVTGYRAGVDPVILAACIPALSGQTVLELGCGVGTASLCLGYRVSGLKLSGIEIQSDYAELARQNARLNEAHLEVHCGDLSNMPPELRQQSFDHVIANPPYFDRAASTAAKDAGREIAMGEATPLTVWVNTAARRLKPKGFATFIHRAERLADLLSAMRGQLGSIQVLPLQARVGRDAGLVVVRARKGGRAAFRLHAPLIMHEGDRHEEDGESYTERFRQALRHGAALGFPE